MRYVVSPPLPEPLLDRLHTLVGLLALRVPLELAVQPACIDEALERRLERVEAGVDGLTVALELGWGGGGGEGEGERGEEGDEVGEGVEVRVCWGGGGQAGGEGGDLGELGGGGRG